MQQVLEAVLGFIRYLGVTQVTRRTAGHWRTSPEKTGTVRGELE